YSGDPLTHRDYEQSVRLITGHVQADQQLDWTNLVADKQTLVFYMGLSQAAVIQQQLLTHGMRANMPVMIVENGTRPQQKVSSGTLSILSELAKQRQSPSLIIIGQVVALREILAWF